MFMYILSNILTERPSPPRHTKPPQTPPPARSPRGWRSRCAGPPRPGGWVILFVCVCGGGYVIIIKMHVYPTHAQPNHQYKPTTHTHPNHPPHPIWWVKKARNACVIIVPTHPPQLGREVLQQPGQDHGVDAARQGDGEGIGVASNNVIGCWGGGVCVVCVVCVRGGGGLYWVEGDGGVGCVYVSPLPPPPIHPHNNRPHSLSR